MSLYDTTNKPNNGFIQNIKKTTIALAAISALSLSISDNALAKNNQQLNNNDEPPPYTYNDKKLNPAERNDVIYALREIGVLKNDNRFHYISTEASNNIMKQMKAEDRITPSIENDEKKYSVTKYNTGIPYETWKENAQNYVQHASVLNINKKMWELMVENSMPEIYNIRTFQYKSEQERFKYFMALNTASVEKAEIQYFEFIQKNYPNEKNAFSALCDTVVQFNTLDMSKKEVRKEFLTCDENFRLKKEHTPLLGESNFLRDYPTVDKNDLLNIPISGYRVPTL